MSPPPLLTAQTPLKRNSDGVVNSTEYRPDMDPELTHSQVRSLSLTPAGGSPYPWSQRQLQFSSALSPFPRYGAAVNAGVSKEGLIYMMGGLVNSRLVKGDLWMIELATGQLACYPVNPSSKGPCPRLGHASLLVGNAFIVFGGDTRTEEGDVLDDTLYLLNTGKLIPNCYQNFIC